jgi:hypothetical protein
VRPSGWLPGQLLVGVDVAVGPTTQPIELLRAVRARVAEVLGADIPLDKPTEDEPVLLLPRAETERQLLFVPVRLVDRSPRTMRLAIARLNRGANRPFGDDTTLVAATPNWFSGAQFADAGSPASQPVPTKPYGGRVRYAPQVERLDLAKQASEAHQRQPNGPHVAVLDTAPEPVDLDWALAEFPNNDHLRELVQRLVGPFGSLAPSALETARQQALQELEQNGGFRPIEPAYPYDIRDHGLFVAGVVHATAPWAPLRLIRVLNNFGVGSLHALLIGLVGLLAEPRSQSLVINLSLGVLPPREQLTSIWFGLPVDGLPGCPADPTLQFLPERPELGPAQVVELVTERPEAVAESLDLLQTPVHRLMDVLLAHQCLVVAAAGNDSVYRGVERRPRWGPRIPAVFDTVLGVAADTIRPTVPARYANRGELPAAAVRDAVASLGGDLAADGISPRAGVIGVYTAEHFPPLLPPAGPALNLTGWAEWSGSSFATPIVAGIAANLWMTDPARSATQILADMNALTRADSRPDVPDLGVPGIPVRLIWLP